METIFNFSDYRNYLKARIEQMPRGGYGQLGKLAVHMNVHTSLVSHILSGQKSLNDDLAVACADFFGLSDLETDYLLALVELDRAGTELMRKTARRRISEVKKKAADLSQRTPSARKVINEEQQAVFYSSWMYSAARQLSAIGNGTTVDELSEKFQVTTVIAKQIVEFLLSSGLCIEKKHRIVIGTAHTHTDANSPWVRVFHRTWRDKTLRSVEQQRKTGFHFTGPMTLSVEDAEKVRLLIVEMTQKVSKITDPSPSETLRCLCIDWFDPL